MASVSVDGVVCEVGLLTFLVAFHVKKEYGEEEV